MEYLNVRTMERSKGFSPFDLVLQSAQPQSSDSDQGYTTGQASDNSLPENVILQTKNYAMFKVDPLNRVIRQDKVDRLYDAVQTKNLLHLFPIVVTRQFVIVDGQHRWKVAEALDTPIYYIVSSQMRIEDAASANANTDGWTTADYLDHWCQIGLPDYLELRRFGDGKKWLSVSRLTGLCHKGDKGGREKTDTLHRDFVNGKYKANNMEQAERVCVMALNFSSWVTFWKDSAFMSALRNLDNNADYDHARMMQKMQSLSTKLVRCSSAADYIAVMNTIYNFRTTEANRVTLTLISNRHSANWRD